MKYARGCCFLVMAAIFVAMAPGFAAAGELAPCNSPDMFPNSDATVFVFPFVDYTSPDSSRVESPVGTELAGLIQADTLLAIGRFGRVAAIRMLGRPSDCQPTVVFRGLMDRFWSNRGSRSIVMLWGRIFRADTEIYVQSYASFGRFVEKDPGEMIQLPIGDRVLAAQLTAQTLTFPPRHVSAEDLKLIREQFAKQAVVHETPDEHSPGKPLLQLFPADRPPIYYMTDTQGDWIRIRTQTGHDGWIRAHGMLGQQSLSSRLPEMKFVEGVVGYFGFRAQPTPAKAELADAALRAFEDSPLSATAPVAIAVSRQLRGMMVLLAQNQSDAAFDKAASLFADAAAALPSNSAASNMATVAGLYRDWKQPARKLNFQESTNRFWTSISANPNDTTALTNCWTLITIARNPAFHDRFIFEPALSDEDLARKAREIAEVQLRGTPVRLAHAVPVVPWPKSQ